jgi:large subunit ribosomal protein L16
MLMPQNLKFNKQQKGKARGFSKNTLTFGSFGLQMLEPGRIKANQLEAARKAIRQALKKTGKLYIRVFPDIPVTKKPLEIRMGKGKGAVDHYITRIKKNQIIFELADIEFKLAKLSFKLAADKLPLKTYFLQKNFKELK